MLATGCSYRLLHSARFAPRLCDRAAPARRHLVLPTTCAASAMSSRSGLSLSAGGASGPSTVRVVTYNVLCSHLGGPDWFQACKPEDLKPATRLERVLAKLEVEMAKDSVICLQEVSMTWAGALVPFFAARGYTWVGHLYGEFRNNYMGVGIAYPTRRFVPTQVDILRVGDLLPRPRAPKPTGLARYTARLKDLVSRLRQTVSGSRPPMDVYTAAQRRFNALVFAKLQDVRSNGTAFAIGCYHMPCAFTQPGLMTIHAAAVAQKALSLAATGTPTPLVLVGDWNFKPEDAQYAMLTTGQGPQEGDPARPALPLGLSPDAFSCTLPVALRSAYAECHDGKEPDCTNYAKVKDDATFVETLDYIFVGEGVQVLSADDMPHRTAIQGPLPNASEPSDHLLLAANLRVYPAQ